MICKIWAFQPFKSKVMLCFLSLCYDKNKSLSRMK